MLLAILVILGSVDSIAVEEEQSLFNVRPFLIVDLGVNVMTTSLNQRSVDYFDFEILHGKGTAGVIGARAGTLFLGNLGLYGEARSWIWGTSLWGEGGAGGDEWVNVYTKMFGGGISYVNEFDNGNIAGVNIGLGSYGGSIELRSRDINPTGTVWNGDFRDNLGFNICVIYGGPIHSEIVDAFWALEFAYHSANQELEETYTGVVPQSEDMNLFDIKICLMYVMR